jgi:ABC-type nitrate/sulfonate/bicarbonate transport system permease component
MSSGAASTARLGALRARRGQWSGFALVAAALIAWELSVRSGAVQSESWPALSKVLAAIGSGLRSEGWAQIFGSSMYRLACGYAIAVLSGVAVGLLVGASRRADAILNPTIEIFRVLPIPAIVPPLIFLLGLDDALKITVIALAAFFPIALNTAAGVRAMDPVHLLVARTFRTPRSRIVFGIQLPSALPYVFAGCRISLGIALIVTVVTEMIAGSQGVGFYIVSMQYAMRPEDMYAAIILLSAIGYLLNRLFLAIESRSIHWARALEARGNE